MAIIDEPKWRTTLIITKDVTGRDEAGKMTQFKETHTVPEPAKRRVRRYVSEHDENRQIKQVVEEHQEAYS